MTLSPPVCGVFSTSPNRPSYLLWWQVPLNEISAHCSLFLEIYPLFPSHHQAPKKTTILDKLKHYFLLPSEKWLYLGKKNYEYDTEWIVFVPGGTADKKLEGIHKNCFLFSSNVFFTFVHLGMPFSGGGGGMGDNSNSTAKFKIQFMNSSPALWLLWALVHFFFLQNKAIKTEHEWNYCEVKPAKLLFWAQSTTFLCSKNDFTPRFNVLSC